MTDSDPKTAGDVAQALQVVGDTDGLRAALEHEARDAEIAEALEVAGGSHLVAEAMVAIAEAVSLRQPMDPDVAEAIESVGGISALTGALGAASGSAMVAEALEAVGGEAGISAALGGAGTDRST